MKSSSLVYFKATLILFIQMFFIMQGCGNSSQEEIERLKSPDSLVDAVLIRTNTGATAPFAYALYLVPSGGQPIKGHEILIADHINGLRVGWKRQQFLEIRYDNGRIFHFTNFWSSKKIENFKYIVEIQLIEVRREEVKK